MANKRSRIYLIFSFLFALVMSFSAFSFATSNVGLFASAETVAQEEKGYAVHYIDVGQGDSIFLELPDGKTMLIDAGPRSAEDAVVDYIKGLNYSVIDYVVLTHSDEDHSGGMAKVFENFEIKNIYRPFVLASNDDILTDGDDLEGLYDSSEIHIVTTNVYATFILKAYSETYDNGSKNAKVYVNYDGLTILSSSSEKPYVIEFHSPSVVGNSKIPSVNTDGYPTKMFDGADSNKANSVSPIMTFSVNDDVYMFTGDATEDSEADFLANLDDEDRVLCKSIDVLKVAHHGSSTSSCDEFLELVNPSIAVVQCGKDNKYGHPHEEVLNRLDSKWSMAGGDHFLYRTDLNGNIVISEKSIAETSALIEGSGIYVTLDAQTGKEKTESVPQWTIYVALGVIVLFILICLLVKVAKKKKLTKTDVKKAKRQYNKSRKVVEEIRSRRK